MSAPAVIYACSHRKGNSDRAAELLAEGISQAGGTAETITLRNFEVQHCIACGYCDENTDGRLENRCVLAKKDRAADLFAPLFSAPVVFFASPIYFYSVPSRLKAWMDRGQQFWAAHMNSEPWVSELPKRKAYTVMVAGRPTGKKLFEGAELSLKYFLRYFNLTTTKSLHYYGVDAPGDLCAEPRTADEILNLGRTGWQQTDVGKTRTTR